MTGGLAIGKIPVIRNGSRGTIQEIKERTGRTLSPGALWVSMENLYKRGLVEKRLADSTSEIGGRGKIYYNLTLQGKKELNSVLELNRLLWEDISGFITEKA